MITYNTFHIESKSETEIKIHLISTSDDADSYTFEMETNIYNPSNIYYRQLLFGRFWAESKSGFVIELTDQITQERISLPTEVVLNIIDKIETKTQTTGNHFLQECLTVWQDKIFTLIENRDVSMENAGKKSSEVLIYIPETPSLYDQENVVNACGEFMEALGFELETEDEPIYNSFWKKIKFIFKKNLTEQDVHNLFDKGKKALELKYVELPTAEQTEKLASAVEKILNSVDKFTSCTIRVGSLLIIKRNIAGEPTLKIHQLTPEEIKYLEENNTLLRDPDPLAVLQNKIQRDNNMKMAKSIINDSLRSVKTKTESEVLVINENKELPTSEPALDNLPENKTKEGGSHAQGKM